ncbi:cytidine deaminase [Geomicrobium sp. JCM 19039]|uniref:cytidine deaminase n=1 Tax=Geomicrobium sp. JCM 19039 TaxID=1460636 RepID=UPI00045F2FE3|nr:cytidine deaminase [Geomicrobium sp. JCM 19039]GAK11469.1 cytidine deaminase [Geomicrobium sp. JCM 19039]
MSDLQTLAEKARSNAYVPYSKFQVGASLETEDGTLFTGANIENASYGLTNCAERTAIFKAMSEGHRKIKKLYVTADTEGPVSPCGACRQVIAEFMDSTGEVILGNLKGETRTVTIATLLPGAFEAGDMNDKQ